MAAHVRLLVVLAWLVVTYAGPDMCQEGYNNNGTTITFDTTCSTNCSQEIDKWIFVNKNCSQYPPRIDGDTQFFNCSIGGQREVTKYRQTNSKHFDVSSQTFTAPMIKEVELYYKCFSNGCYRTEMALKFKFFLPPGIVGKEVSDSVMPKAVLLRFESIEDVSVRDEYYYVCPRERIFQFHNYSLVNAYDLYNLRELSYDCLVGLQTNHQVVYNITLQTVQGQSASYITTIIPRQPNFITTIIPWQPVIMTHSNVTDYSLLVVIEKAPPMYKVRAYTIELIREPAMVVRSTNTIDFKNKRYTNFTTFRNVTTGRYHIKVIPRCPTACVVNTTSYHIVYIGHDGNYPDYLEESIDAMQVVAMVSGCVGGVGLVIVAILFLLRVRKHQERYSGVKPKGYIIHPHKPDSQEYEIVRHLKSFITEYCECTVLDYLEMKVNTDLAESREERIKNSLRESSFVVVTYSHTHHDDRTANNSCSDVYSFVLNKTIEQRKRSNNLRIIEIRFPANSNVCPTILSEHRRSVKTVNFSTEPEQLYCKIHGTKKPPENNANEALKSTTQWRHIMAHFQSGVGCMRTVTSRSEQSEVEPLLAEDKPDTTKDNLHEHEHLNQNLQKEDGIIAIFKQMASLNQDTDDDSDHFNPAESQEQALHSTHCEPISLTRCIEQRHSDIDNNNSGCSMSIEADVHIDHLRGNGPVNNQQVSFKNKAKHDIKIAEPLPRISKGPANTVKVKSFNNAPVSMTEHVNNNRRVINRQHVHSLPETGYHEHKNNEQTNRRQPQRVLRNEKMLNMNVTHVPNVKSARQMLNDFNDSDIDNDDCGDNYPVEQYQDCGYNDFPHSPDFHGAQPIHHYHPHPCHQQYHPLLYDDTIGYDVHARQIEMDAARGSHFGMPRDYVGGINYNKGSTYSHAGTYIEQPHTNELYLNGFQPDDNVCYQRHANGFDTRLPVPRSLLHRFGAHMTHADFHPQHNTRAPIHSPIIPRDLLLDRTEETNISFNAVDPRTERIHETSVKERYGAPSVTRSSSSKSLPPDMWNAPNDLDSDQIGINEYNRYNPIPPDEEDDQQSLQGFSDIGEQLLEINQMARPK